MNKPETASKKRLTRGQLLPEVNPCGVTKEMKRKGNFGSEFRWINAQATQVPLRWLRPTRCC